MSDLIFFTGLEGCVSTADVGHLFAFTHFKWHGGLYDNMGYMGSKAVGLIHFWDGAADRNWIGQTVSNLNTKTIAMGGHFLQTVPPQQGHANFGSFRNIFRIHSTNSATITVCTTNTEIVIRVGGSIIEVISTWFRPINIYQHASILIDKTIGKIQIVLNQDEIFNKSGLSIASDDFFSQVYWDTISNVPYQHGVVVYWDNMWIHKNKILGEVRSFYSLPTEDGFWDKDSGGFQPSSGAYLHPMLQTKSDANYVTSDTLGHKFTCKQTEIPEGFTPLGFTLQNVTRTMEAGGKIGIKNLVRTDDQDYSGRRFFVPDRYTNSVAFRETFDVMPNGSEITREKLNDLEFGIELVE